jgi:uncharacterized protein (DUF58 family)
MWRERWQRFLRAARGGMSQRLTLAGFLFSLATVLVGALAFLTANNLLFLILAALLATLLVGGFISRLSLAGLELDFDLPPHVTARSRNTASLRLKNEKALMPAFSIHVAGTPGSAYASRVYFPIVPPHKTVTTTVEVAFARRGLHTENSFLLESRFPFGFAERRIDLTLHRDIVVYPCLDPAPETADLAQRVDGEMAASRRGSGHDFYRIRPYEANESARHLDWRASAHTGELQVREFTHDQEPMVDILLDIRLPAESSDGPAYREWFERAVDSCAYLCWRINSHAGRVRLRAGKFDRIVPDESDIYEVLEFLALVSPIAPGVGMAGLEADGSPLSSSAPDCVRIIFSALPGSVSEAGLRNTHLVEPGGTHSHVGSAYGN